LIECSEEILGNFHGGCILSLLLLHFLFLKKGFPKGFEISCSWAWWFMPVIPAPWKLRHEDCEFELRVWFKEFEDSLDFIVRPCLK
jgi:hypothetical protein